MLDLDKWSVYRMALCVAFYCVDSEKDLTNADDRHNCKLTIGLRKIVVETHLGCFRNVFFLLNLFNPS